MNQQNDWQQERNQVCKNASQPVQQARAREEPGVQDHESAQQVAAREDGAIREE